MTVNKPTPMWSRQDRDVRSTRYFGEDLSFDVRARCETRVRPSSPRCGVRARCRHG